MLCPSKFLKCNNNDSFRVSPCGQNCYICNFFPNVNDVKFENGQVFHIKSKMDCNSVYVIYVLLCTKCTFTYIGETENLFDRTYKHIYAVRNPDKMKYNCDRHFYESGGKPCEFKCIPFFKCYNENVVYRRKYLGRIRNCLFLFIFFFIFSVILRFLGLRLGFYG